MNGSRTCTVCGTEISKYKCPACKAPSCSLPCFKTHGLECGIGGSAERKDGEESGSGIDVRETGTAGVTVSDGMRDSFSVADVQALFVRYPGLKTKLALIYEVTLDPKGGRRSGDGGTVDEFSATGAGTGTARSADRRYERAWNSERGFEKGLGALRAAVDAAGPDSEGMEEFLKLVRGSVDK